MRRRMKTVGSHIFQAAVFCLWGSASLSFGYLAMFVSLPPNTTFTRTFEFMAQIPLAELGPRDEAGRAGNHEHKSERHQQELVARSRGNALLQKTNFLCILKHHCFRRFSIAFFPADLTTSGSIWILPALHATTDKGTFHTVELTKDAEDKAGYRIDLSIGEQCFKAILMDIYAYCARWGILPS